MGKIGKNILLIFGVVTAFVAIVSGCNQPMDNKVKVDHIIDDYSEDKDTFSVSIESSLTKQRDVGVHIPLSYANKTDKNGRKHGIWIEETENGFLSIYTYKNGVLDGHEMCYNNRENPIMLENILNHSDGELKEILMIDNNGLISAIIQDIRINDKYSEFNHVFPYLGYHKCFKNGKIICEGDLIFDDDWQINGTEIGDWKHYEEDGSFTIRDGLPSGFNIHGYELP